MLKGKGYIIIVLCTALTIGVLAYFRITSFKDDPNSELTASARSET